MISNTVEIKSKLQWDIKLAKTTKIISATWNSVQPYVDRRGVFGRMDTCIPVAEPLPCSPETVTLLIGYTPLKDKKFLKKKDYEC